MKDSANWSVRASNSAGYAESHAKLTVLEASPAKKLSAPVFVSALKDGNTKESNTFEFRCRVVGHPTPKSSWFKNGICIDQSSQYTIDDCSGGDCVLKIQQASLEDSNEFCCRASNEVGNSQTSARLHVLPLEPTELPIFVEPLENLEVQTGQELKLECRVIGMPTPTITWFQNNRKLFSSSDCKIKYQNDIATLVGESSKMLLIGIHLTH